MTTAKKTSVKNPTTRTTKHKHVYVNDVCKCGTLSRAAASRKAMAEREAERERIDAYFAAPIVRDPMTDMVITDYDPMAAANQTYTLLFENDRPGYDMVKMTEVVTAGNAYDALKVGMYLSGPVKGEVIIVTWTNLAGEEREFSTKVLVRK